MSGFPWVTAQLLEQPKPFPPCTDLEIIEKGELI